MKPLEGIERAHIELALDLDRIPEEPLPSMVGAAAETRKLREAVIRVGLLLSAELQVLVRAQPGWATDPQYQARVEEAQAKHDQEQKQERRPA